MLIIVEGADCTGKTVLAQRLCDKLDMDYLHVPRRPPEGNFFEFWMAKLRQIKRSTVIDRLHWSEDIYGGLFRGGSRLKDHERWLLEGWLMAHSCNVILCKLQFIPAMNNVEKSPDDLHHNLEQWTQVYHEFEQPWKTQLPVYTYDYVVDPDAESLLYLMKFWPSLGWDHMGIGSSVPSTVFVGEQNSVDSREPLLFQSASGDFLRRALELTNYGMRHYHVTNAYRDDGSPQEISAPWRSTAQIVALGDRAAEALGRMQVEHTLIPYPDYCGDLRGYVEKIREVTL